MAADRAVDVRGIAEQEHAPLAEVMRDAVVDTIGREPIHLRDAELEAFEGFALHVVESQRAVFAARQVTHGPDQP